MLDRYLENDGVALSTFEEACAMAKILIDNGNAVLISMEEQLYIVNWVWCSEECADRNMVVFRNREDAELELMHPAGEESCDL